MVFTDTIKYFSIEKIPIVAMTMDSSFETIATLLQNGDIKIWNIIDIYKWEYDLRKGIEDGVYDQSAEVKPAFILKTQALDYGINFIRFSSKYNKLVFFRDKPTQETIEGKSKLEPGKKIKVTVISRKSITSVEQDPSPILTLFGDNGNISFASLVKQE